MKYIKNLANRTESVLQESLVSDAAEVTGIDKDIIDDAVKELSFANYLELGNAIDIEDAETIKEILNVTGQVETEPEFDLPGGEPDLEEASYDPFTPDTSRPFAGDVVEYADYRGPDLVGSSQTRMHGKRGVVLTTSLHLTRAGIIRVKFEGRQKASTVRIDQLTIVKKGNPNINYAMHEDRYEDETDECIVCSQLGYETGKDAWGETCFNCGGRGRVMKNGDYIDDDWEDSLEEAEYIKGKNPNKSKNYMRTGGNKQQFKWRITLNNGKVLLRWADSRYNATHGQLSPEQHIIGIRSAKRIKMTEADRPTATQTGQVAKSGIAPIGSTAGLAGAKDAAQAALQAGGPEGITTQGDISNPAPTATPATPAQPAVAPSAGSSIDALAAPAEVAGAEEGTPPGRKDVEDLQVGDEIEIADIDGQPAAGRIRNVNGPGNTIVITGKGNEEHMIRKDSILSTPLIPVQENRQTWLATNQRKTKDQRAARVEKKKKKDIYEQDDMMTCPECDGKGGFRQPHMGEMEWDHCPTCDGKKTIKRSQDPYADDNGVIEPNDYHVDLDEMRVKFEKALNEDTQESPIKALRTILQDQGIRTGRGYNDKNVGNRKIRVYTGSLTNKKINRNLEDVEAIVKTGMEKAGYRVRKVRAYSGMSSKDPNYFPGGGRDARMYPNVAVWLEGNPVGARYQTELDEVAPPGMEDWITKRKPEFKKRYGKDWESALYATAWKQKNNESIDEDVADKHQKKIAIDTVKNPDKSLLGGPSAEEAEKTLRDKFGYDDKKIAKLKEADQGLHFWVEPLANGIFEVRNSEGDIHDVYDSGEEARKAAAELNAQYGKVEESMFDNIGRQLEVGHTVFDSRGQSGEVVKFTDQSFKGNRVAVIKYYGSNGDNGREYFYKSVDENNIQLDEELTRLKELAGLNEVKAGNFKSKMIGQRVRIMAVNSFGKDHIGEEGVVTRASREHTFSQMVPFIVEYGVLLDSGERMSIRRESVRKVKTVTEMRRGNETNAEEMRRLKRELKQATDQHEQSSLRLEIRKLQGEIDLRKERRVTESPDKHQKKIAIDTVKNPNKALLGGPSAKEAEDTLRNKFGYTDRQIAKLKETASGGGTGAGAIASSPTALGGMQKRNPSIYGQTKLRKKPTPKKRPTREEAGDGIGRKKKS